MPQHKSCKKRMVTSEEQRIRNRAFRTTMRSAIKAVRAEQSKEAALGKLRQAEQVLDKAASFGLIHRNRAARHKSRLAIQVNKLG